MEQTSKKEKILQTLAFMLEQPSPEKITTANLARQLDVSEAALYRHFASKAQMFEGLIGFIESALFGTLNRIIDETSVGTEQIHAILTFLLLFSEKNKGMTRVLIGEALVHENDRLQERVNKIGQRIESTLKQQIRLAELAGLWPERLKGTLFAPLALGYITGKWHLFAKSKFERLPSENWEEIKSIWY